MKTLADLLRTSWAGLRLLLLLTLVLGVAYPLLITGVAQLPGLQSRADGSLLHQNGAVVGSSLIGQNFTDSSGSPLPKYFQPRPSAAGEGYDPTASGASNLGPESIVDVLPNPAVKGDEGKPSLLTQVCTRSLAIGKLDGVDGARPFCTPDGVGAVLAVFWSGPGYAGHITKVVSVNQTGTPFQNAYHGVAVQPAVYGQDYSAGQLVPVHGNAPARPAVPADAVTASGSGLDPDISPAYAAIQVNRVAKARGLSPDRVRALVRSYTSGRGLGFLGSPVVNVVQLNAALDRLGH
ncbi:MAG TPA: potassium-transporting ATPase subunit C [Jatrophihabitans sp.]|nr:potassium-transporting ATPase subunit C [Jatrophihabitans sp.]